MQTGRNLDQVLQDSCERLIVGRKEELEELVTAFGRRVHEEHPNPERVGCPERAALTRLAKEPVSVDAEPLLDHILQCAACLDELRDLRRESRSQQQP